MPHTDLRVHSCLWVRDQREGQQHHDHSTGAHPAAEQVQSKSGHNGAAFPWDADALLFCWEEGWRGWGGLHMTPG